MQDETWTPDERQLNGDLNHLRTVLDQRVRRVEAISVLARVAERLCPETKGIDGVMAVVQLAVDRLRDPRKEVAELLYGLSAESAGKKIKDRRELALAKYREIAGYNYTYESFRTNGEKTLITDLTTALIALVTESYLPTDASPNNASSLAPETRLTHEATVPAPVPKHSRRSARSGLIRRTALVLTISAGVVLALVLTLRSGAERTSHLPSVSHLEAETERQLVGSQVPSPGSHPTSTLGWGDPSSRGRKIYYPGNPAPPTPTLNALYDNNEDERQFLGIAASRIANAQQLGALTEQRATVAHSGMVVWVFAKVVNNAAPPTTCELLEPVTAKNVRLQLRIWNAPHKRLHIIRVWISASNATPRWITDAVAVVTTRPVTLTPNREISREYSGVTPYFKNGQSFDVGSLANPGFSIGSVGSCSHNSYYFDIAFHQLVDLVEHG